jgi:SAM-dependent methyltransferase
MNEILFDRKLLINNRKRYSLKSSDYNFLHQKCADKIFEDINSLPNNYNDTLELQAFNDYLCKLVKTNNNQVNYVRCNDDIICDEEYLPFKNESFDMVISNLNLQFINHIPQFLSQVRQILRPDAVVIMSFLGEDNLTELAHTIYLSENELYGGISSRMIPTIDIKTAGQLFVKSGFKNIIADIDKITIEFETVSQLLYNLKYMCLGNILLSRSRKFFSKKLLKKTCENFQKNYGLDNGNIPATFKIITVIAQK